MQRRSRQSAGDGDVPGFSTFPRATGPTHRPSLHLVLGSPNLVELNWIRELLSDFQLIEHIGHHEPPLLSHALYVFSQDHTRFDVLASRGFFDRLRSMTAVGLLHLSDEFFRGDYRCYSCFDYVIRNYHSRYFEAGGVMSIPLGYSNGFESRTSITRSSDRPHMWSFAGNLTVARRQMIDVMDGVTPHRVFVYGNTVAGQPLKKEAYRDLLGESVFCPCPMGNVVLETYRLYEALEMGCIPIIERRPSLDYYSRLLPGHPIPCVNRWRDAPGLIDLLIKDAARLNETQNEIVAWWRGFKAALRVRLSEAVSSASAGDRTSLQHWAAAPSFYFHLWRRAELLRHSTITISANRLQASIKARYLRDGIRTRSGSTARPS